jgi:lysophospholipase L1-like esterase
MVDDMMRKMGAILIIIMCLLSYGCGTEADNAPNESTHQLYALGDSITQGYYSYFDENGEAKLGLDEDRCWAQIVADRNGWTLTNLGVGGSGFVHPGTVLDKMDAREHVDTIDFSGADLVTISYGVNDWKYDMPLGSMEDDVATGGTFYSNMRYCIEKISSDEPLAKIVVISPINCCRYGTYEGNWGIGYAFENNGTLEDIFAAQKEICDYYGIEFIDMLHASTVNRLNAPELLPDGVHPSLEAHASLAEELAVKIN